MGFWIGGPNQRGSEFIEAEVPGSELLSDAASSHLLREDVLAIPWRLALLSADLLEAEEDREQVLRAKRPTWLSVDDLEILLDVVEAAKLPRRSPLRLRLGFRGMAGRPGFELQAQWRGGGGRPLREPPRVEGGLVHHGDAPPRRMTLGQYAVLQSLAGLEGLGTDRNADLLRQAELAASVPQGDPGCELDPGLARNEVRPVQSVAPRLRPVEAGYQVRPAADGVPDAALEDHYYNTRPEELGSRPLVFREGDQRVRAVFEPRAVEGMKKCRELHQMTPADAAHAMSHPVEVFGDDLDLSEFGERVVGVGPEIKRSYPVLREIKSESWWDWDVAVQLAALDEEPGTPASELSLKDAAVREQLTTAIEQADARGDAYIPDPAGGLIELTPAVRQAVASANELADATAEQGGRLKRKPREVLQVLENVESLTFEAEVSARDTPRLHLGTPPGLRGQLFDYQQEGFEWLASLYRQRRDNNGAWAGALLADDMGLGKTLQVLSFLAWAREHEGGGPHLLVAPVGLLDNWQREASAFFGGLHEPMMQVTGRSLPNDPGVAAARLGAQHIALVCYETLRRHEQVFARVAWNVVILDEAQKAKEPASQVARALRTLKARFRLAMTGTPVENTLKELWCVFDWATPGLLGSLRSFADEYIRPLKDGGDGARHMLASRLQATVEPVFTRRLKQDMLKNLPAIHHHHVEVDLSPEQEEIYAQILETKSTKAKGMDALGKLAHLFAACAHPGFARGEENLPTLDECEFPRATRLIELLEDVHRRGEKAILFANRRKLHWWLADTVSRRYGIDVDVINGQVNNSKARMAKIDRFSAKPGFGAIVLAPRAAGVGLNITAANHVIHYTREWNPAIENQATDRAYRMGQKRPVNVYYMIGRSDRGTTVDQRLDSLLTKKRKLMADFVVPMGSFDVTAGELAE